MYVNWLKVGRAALSVEDWHPALLLLQQETQPQEPEEFRVVVALRLKLVGKTRMRFPGELERL